MEFYIYEFEDKCGTGISNKTVLFQQLNILITSIGVRIIQELKCVNKVNKISVLYVQLGNLCQ
jgi:hypothetical protein